MPCAPIAITGRQRSAARPLRHGGDDFGKFIVDHGRKHVHGASSRHNSAAALWPLASAAIDRNGCLFAGARCTLYSLNAARKTAIRASADSAAAPSNDQCFLAGCSRRRCRARGVMRTRPAHRRADGRPDEHSRNTRQRDQPAPGIAARTAPDRQGVLDRDARHRLRCGLIGARRERLGSAGGEIIGERWALSASPCVPSWRSSRTRLFDHAR